MTRKRHALPPRDLGKHAVEPQKTLAGATANGVVHAFMHTAIGQHRQTDIHRPLHAVLLLCLAYV